MEELDIATITKRSIRGVFALVSRTFVIQAITFVTNFLLTIFLSPEIFGVYFVVSAAIAFLGYFSDIGLAAALIQKKDQITERELRTTFTIQQILVVSVVIVAISLSGLVKEFYKLNADAILLYQALAVAFFLSSLKTIPSIILERELRFDKLVIPQIVETIFFSACAIYFAISGYGITSFTIAVLARGISGVIAMYIVVPWRIGFSLSRHTAKGLLSFGIPFQANSFLALVKDDLLIVYLGRVLPLSAVGYIGFAQKWAFTPLRLFMDNVIRITFPSFSRLQHDRPMLSKAVEKSVFVSCLFIFPALVVLVCYAPYFIEFIPKYAKWEPALIGLGFFSLNAALSSVSTPLTNALNAIGKIKTTLYLMIFWTAATWLITPVAIKMYGYNGVPFASAIISFSVILVILIVRKYINFNPLILMPVIFSSIVMVLSAIIFGNFINNLPATFIFIFSSLILYSGSMWLLANKELKTNIGLLVSNLKK